MSGAAVGVGDRRQDLPQPAFAAGGGSLGQVGRDDGRGCGQIRLAMRLAPGVARRSG